LSNAAGTAAPHAARRPECAFVAAANARDRGERLLAQTLETLTWLARAAIAIGYRVDGRGLAEITLTHGDAARAAQRLRQLEPIDPFSPRRAQERGATVLSAADVGGLDAYARSLHGQRFRQDGHGAPVVIYLRRAERIAAGVTLLRARDEPAFEAKVVRLLRELHPLLQAGFAAQPHERTPQPSPGLTDRESEVARLVAGGATNASIATALTLSEATVKAHLTKVYAKLGIRSRTQLAVVMSGVGIRSRTQPAVVIDAR
jgi:DNA-binding CsgD family transcriptional regulator